MMTFAQWSTSNCYLFYGLTSLFGGNRFALTVYAAKTRGPRKRERIEGPWCESHNSWRAEWRNLRPWRCVLCQEYATERKSFTIVANTNSQSEARRSELGLGLPPLFRLTLLYMYRNTDHWLLLVRRKLPITHWLSLEIHVRGRARKKNLCQTHLFNIWTIGAMLRTSGQTQVAKYFFKNWSTMQLMSLNTVVMVSKLEKTTECFRSCFCFCSCIHCCKDVAT